MKNEQAVWYPAFEEFVTSDWALIREQAGSLLLDVDWDSVGPCIRAQEYAQLGQLCNRTLVLELNCARLLEQLVGETAEERFAHFLSKLRQPGQWAALFDEYEGLGQDVHETRQRFRAQVVELLARLAADKEAIATSFFPGEKTLRFRSASSGLSDRHRSGRSVWKLTFDLGGAEANLMYKPKSLAVDARFQALLSECNLSIAHGDLDGIGPFRVLKILDRGDYGYSEYVTSDPCATPEASHRFYVRQGALLSLLHILCSTDIHQENLIAHGEYPVAIDLETLFHPPFVGNESEPSAGRAAQALLGDSILRVGLLPWRVWRKEGKGGLLVGGIGDGSPQLLPYAVPGWEHDGRDDMHMVERQITVPPSDNVPKVNGRAVPFFHHVEAILFGFEKMARYISSRRTKWAAPGGWLDAFAGDPVRYVLRPTAIYAEILYACTHPDHLREKGGAATVCAALDQGFTFASWLPRVRSAENADLANRDIPYFSGRPDSPDLWDSQGRRHEAFFPSSGLEYARSRLQAFDDKNVTYQAWLVRAALAAAAFGKRVLPPAGGAASLPLPNAGETLPPPYANGRPLPERALALAADLGARIADRAVLGRNDLTWIGVVVDCSAEDYTIGPLRADLYDGVTGIALFLAYLGRFTAEDRFLEMAVRIGRGMLRERLEMDRSSGTTGGFLGITSRLYALAHLDALADEGLTRRALTPHLLKTLESSIAAEKQVDIIYGAAGAILALLAVYEESPGEALLPLLVSCLSTIERTAVRYENGIAWLSPVGPRPLLGFSHGNAGIVYALERLNAFLRGIGHSAAERCPGLIADALRYERSLFDPLQQNWPDFRFEEAGSPISWCHGAPGVALGRLASLHDTESAKELEIGIATTLANSSIKTQSLCHGSIGNLAIVAHAAEQLGRSDWRESVASRLPRLIDEVAHRPTVDCMFADSVPSLMTGLSGLGLGLLVLARPAEVPLVLGLESPRRSANKKGAQPVA